ncbi:MAG: M48 family metalloprotease [Cyanobacteria bacterium P01_D01_bin.105]
MTTATDWEGLLNTGITAYKRGHYTQAIATFKQLGRCPSSTLRTKAGMGLVRAYMATQNWGRAKALCETIKISSNPAVQTWAKDTLSKIEQRSQQASTAADLSGFTPLGSSRTPAEDIGAGNIRAGNIRAERESRLSIFHYDYLNDEIEAKKTDTADIITNQTTTEELPNNTTLTAVTPISTKKPDESQPSYEWRNSGRLSKGRSLGKMKRQQIWLSQTFGAISLYALVLFVTHSMIVEYNNFIRLISRLLPFWIIQHLPLQSLSDNYGDLALKELIAWGAAAIAAPWLWDLCLRFTTQRQSFSTQKLRQHSPEAASLMTKRCQKQHWPTPTLWKLTTSVPLLFSYGWRPRNARLVVTDGLLSNLSAEELATLVSYEMSHWQTLYWPLLSLQGLVLLLFHQGYWTVALWGNRQSGHLRWMAGVLSNVSYGLFWIIRLPGLWVSRVRTYYGDRAAVQLTGNPNALTRALAKLSFALAHSTEQQGYTPPTIEQFSLLLPVSMELTRSSLYGTLPLAEVFAWDSQHPLRNWMSVQDPHPPLGDRLRLLMAYAKHWKLEPEIPFATIASMRKKGLSRQNWFTLIRQGTPFFGLIIGIGIGLGCWVLGGIGHWLEWPAIDWMYEDSGIFWFCPLMGFGLGTVLRMNQFFPDLSLGMPSSQDMPSRLCDTTLLPLDSPATKLSGTVLGRPGLANGLGQDLMLKTSDGILKLHVFSTLDAAIGPINTYFLLALGPFGNLIAQRDRPSKLLGKSVQIIGWFRRGNQVWLDVNKVRLSNGRVIEGTHPITSLGIAVIASGLALWLLGFGQIFQEIWHQIKY